MFKKILNKVIYKQILIYIILMFALLLNFQNCAKKDESFKSLSSSMTPQSETIVDIPVADHPIATKTLTTTYSLQLSDRIYLEALLSDVFGPASKNFLRNNVLLKNDDLGGPCSQYSHYKIFNGTTFVNQDDGKICDEDNATKSLLPPAQAVRQGWITQVCTQFIDKNMTTLQFILNRIQPGATTKLLPAVTKENFAKLHKLFYREHPLPPDDVMDSLKLMFSSNPPTLSEWKTAIFSYCISSQWQVL